MVMRVLQIVILTLVVVYPDDVLSQRRGRRTNGDRRIDNGPCGKRFLRQINGKCYYLAGKKMNWFGAQNNCLRKGLNLADLSTEDEFNAIVKFLHSKGNMEDFWFGGNDLQTEGRFTYIANGRPVRYLGGAEGIEETHRSNLDDCLEIRLRQNSTLVTDDNCQEQQYFICQENQVKCAQPVVDETTGVHHSHEHLHHFHHDAAKGEVAEEQGSKESLESDSRPADNSNSTEIGESTEIDQNEEGDEIEGSAGENHDEAENTNETTAAGPSSVGVKLPEGGATAEGETTATAEADTSEADTAEAATAEAVTSEAATDEAVTSEAVTAEAATSEAATEAPSEGETPAAGEAEGGETPAAAEAAEGRAPKAKRSDFEETPTIAEARDREARPVSFDMGANS